MQEDTPLLVLLIVCGVIIVAQIMIWVIG